MSAPSFYRVIDALDHFGALPAHIDGRQNGRLRLMARCPAHDDRSPSLSVEHKGDRDAGPLLRGLRNGARPRKARARIRGPIRRTPQRQGAKCQRP